MLLRQTEQLKRHLQNGGSVRPQRLLKRRSNCKCSRSIRQGLTVFFKKISSILFRPIQVISQPHFLNADLDLVGKIADGLRPNQTKHETFLDIEPVTGSVVKGVKRVQLNIEIFRNKSLE